MKRIFIHASLLAASVIVVWVIAMLSALTWMWHPDWMSGTPPGEWVVGIAFWLATLIGLLLGTALFSAAVRRRLTRAATFLWGVAGMLGIAAIVIAVSS